MLTAPLDEEWLLHWNGFYFFIYLNHFYLIIIHSTVAPPSRQYHRSAWFIICFIIWLVSGDIVVGVVTLRTFQQARLVLTVKVVVTYPGMGTMIRPSGVLYATKWYNMAAIDWVTDRLDILFIVIMNFDWLLIVTYNYYKFSTCL